jgi:hypothetical protein
LEEVNKKVTAFSVLGSFLGDKIVSAANRVDNDVIFTDGTLIVTLNMQPENVFMHAIDAALITEGTNTVLIAQSTATSPTASFAFAVISALLVQAMIQYHALGRAIQC